MMSRFTGPRGRTGVPRLDLFRQAVHDPAFLTQGADALGVP